jgi:hypothetical protein
MLRLSASKGSFLDLIPSRIWSPRFVVVAFLASTPLLAQANGRPPASIDLRIDGSDLLASTTFGVVISKNSGVDWRWTCESALGSGGVFDPDFEPSPISSAVVTTSLDGILLTRDDCTYSKTSLGNRFISTIAVASNGAIFAAASDAEGSKIYRSTDDGMTFPQSSTTAFRNYDSWRSLEVAPSNASRVYATGIRLVFGMPKKYLLYRSSDAGLTFAEMQLTGITGTSANSVIFVAGISHTNPDVLYARVTEDNGTSGEALYRSDNAGDTWTPILSKPDSLYAFVVRRNGDLIAGTPASGSFRSINGGATFTPLIGAPHLSCLTESTDGTLYGCTQNYGTANDDAAVMKSTDGTTWSKVLRFQDIAGPVACAAGTVQKDTCEALEWCGVKEQLGISSTAIDCSAAPDAGQPTATPGGCCDSDGRPQGLLLAGLTLFLLASRRRQSASR